VFGSLEEELMATATRKLELPEHRINVPVAAPMAYFPFSGWKESFFAILHAQGRDAVEFYTESKVVVERWSPEETRHF